jgi:hypothetical protein
VRVAPLHLCYRKQLLMKRLFVSLAGPEIEVIWLSQLIKSFSLAVVNRRTGF